MKKALLLGLALLLVSGVANAQYIGLYVDEHSTCHVYNPGGFFPATFWIWSLPGPNGQTCAEFMIVYPLNIITSTVTANDPIISVTLGDLGTGMSVCFIDCQYDWNWSFQQLIYLTDTAPSHVELVGHPDTGLYQFANCLPGFPLEACTLLNHLALNTDCIVATEDASWGAIKGMFE